MNWFTRLCRRTGLMLHHVVHPDDTSTKARRTEVSRSTSEKKVSRSVTLRRTTIEEIEVRDPGKEE